MPRGVETPAGLSPPLVVRAIVGLLAIGLTGFTAVALTLTLLGAAAGSPAVRLPLAIATVAVLVSCVVVTAVIPAAMVRTASRAAADHPDYADEIIDRQWQATSIVRAALAAAPGTFGVVSLVLTGEPWFAAAPLVALLLLTAAYPTAGSRARFAAAVRSEP